MVMGLEDIGSFFVVKLNQERVGVWKQNIVVKDWKKIGDFSLISMQWIDANDQYIFASIYDAGALKKHLSVVKLSLEGQILWTIAFDSPQKPIEYKKNELGEILVLYGENPDNGEPIYKIVSQSGQIR